MRDMLPAGDGPPKAEMWTAGCHSGHAWEGEKIGFPHTTKV
jgi:hypothetical protein